MSLIGIFVSSNYLNTLFLSTYVLAFVDLRNKVYYVRQPEMFNQYRCIVVIILIAGIIYI